VDLVKSVLSAMSEYKMNVLHLHLTDDQGWRIDLPCRPLLTQRSAQSAVGGGPGGFYTAEDYATLVAYAGARPHPDRARDRRPGARQRGAARVRGAQPVG